jgi:Tol biopolymer transport system component
MRYRPPIGNAIAPVWTPDGRYVLFPAAADPGTRGRWSLWRLEVATGEIVAVAGLAQHLVALQLSHDGRQVLLYGARETNNTELWLIDEQAPAHGPGER